YRRRSAGPPFTGARSSGENTTTRSAPSRSRARRNGWRFTCTRSRPARVSSASTVDRRLSGARSISARTTARSQPWRTSASRGAPRKDASVARYPTASSRLVLPSPLSPAITVSPGAGDTSADSKFRKSVSQRRSTRIASGHANGHQQVEVGGTFVRTNGGRLQRVERFQRDLVALDGLETADAELGVEGDDQL